MDTNIQEDLSSSALPRQTSTPSETISLQPATPSLLGLPSEIRLMILRYLLQAEDILIDEPAALDTRIREIRDREDSDDDSEEEDEDEDEDGDSDTAESDTGDDEGSEHDGAVEEQISNRSFDVVICDTELQSVNTNGVSQTVHAPSVPLPAVRKAPHESQKRYKLYPEILATCRLLNNDGHRLLYDDRTINVLYFYGPTPYRPPSYRSRCEPRAYVLGETSISAALKKYPHLMTIKQWAIQIWWDGEGDDLERAFNDIDRLVLPWSRFIEKEVSTLQTVDSLDYLEIKGDFLEDLSGAYWSSTSAWSSHTVKKRLQLMFCNPFRMLSSGRCLVDVGDSEVGDSLKACIEGSIPIVHPATFRAEFEDLFNEVVKVSDGVFWYLGWLSKTNKRHDHRPLPFQRLQEACNILERVGSSHEEWDLDSLYEQGRLLIRMIPGYVAKALENLNRRTLKLAETKKFEKAEDEDQWSRRDWKEAQVWEEAYGRPKRTKQEIVRKCVWMMQTMDFLQECGRKAEEFLKRYEDY